MRVIPVRKGVFSKVLVVCSPIFNDLNELTDLQ